MSNKICPYPGLRPFTVDESVFFKGRDLHIRKIIDKLEEKKILILTGASGDGKSSLVYAGVIPNARAGFFKAEYSNWLFVTFRPERNPLKNLAQNLAANLNIDAQKCENELHYGFSSLVDLYKESPCYFGEDDKRLINLSENEKRKKKLSGANLFILADQFEEFFTNSENFNNGKPTSNAYTTVNLLLETARIALRDNLPIFVICTMRSDFISQSVAFRGLPETIGFSQFFVPRLNRNELQQVIEEPAILSGGKISKRLKELLINELNDGFDQLPLLQHTLKMLWETAHNGDEEIDLIHLAKVGGIAGKYLPDDDLKRFKKWLDSEGNSMKKYLSAAGASNVLNAHADFLFDSAYDFFLEKADWAGRNLSRQDAELIIKNAFQSLVKLDEGRAVRNRASLREITGIIDSPYIKYEDVCGVLNIFRRQDSSFLYPFINESEPDTVYLASAAVLDITHEALIRNWNKLKKWNEEEYQNFTDFQDFNIQLQRWISSGMSKDFLLSIGPLSYFEEWFLRCKPNKYKLAKYDTSVNAPDYKLDKAEILAENTEEFLTLSRENVTRLEKAKRKRKNILLVLSAIVILTLSGFTYWAMSEKKIAEKQTILAEEQTKEAQNQQKKAVEANLTAQEQRKLAEQNREKAELAKKQSDNAREFAETMRLLAEEKSQLARTEAENAKREKRTADEQRQIADEQRQIAVAASDSAKMLSYLAIAQSLCFKAGQKFDDKQTNLLLALQAYNFNKKYGGYEKDAPVYNALRNSLIISGQKNSTASAPNEVVAFRTFDNILVMLGKNGSMMLFDPGKNKIVNQKQVLQTEVPINNAWFFDQNTVLVNFDDKKVSYTVLETGKTINLLGHSDYIRDARLSGDKTILATGSRDKTVKLWKTENGQLLESFKAADRVNALEMSADKKTLYAGLSNGEFIKIDVETGRSEVISTGASGIFSMKMYNSGQYFALGYESGEVRLFDIRLPSNYISLNASNSAIKQITVSDENDILAVWSDDKIIRIYDLNHIEKNPMYINDLNQKLAGIQISDGKIFSVGADNSIFIWETEPKSYAEKVKKSLTRNFTPDEWKYFIGDKIKYEATR